MSMKLCTQIRFILRNICVDFRKIEPGNRRIGCNWKSKFGNIVALRSFRTRSESHRGYFVIVHLFLHYTRMLVPVTDVGTLMRKAQSKMVNMDSGNQDNTPPILFTWTEYRVGRFLAHWSLLSAGARLISPRESRMFTGVVRHRVR